MACQPDPHAHPDAYQLGRHKAILAGLVEAIDAAGITLDGLGGVWLEQARRILAEAQDDTPGVITDAELDAARLAGPHRGDCPVWSPDPDGIERCTCHDDGPVQLTDAPTIQVALESAFGDGAR